MGDADADSGLRFSAPSAAVKLTLLPPNKAKGAASLETPGKSTTTTYDE